VGEPHVVEDQQAARTALHDRAQAPAGGLQVEVRAVPGCRPVQHVVDLPEYGVLVARLAAEREPENAAPEPVPDATVGAHHLGQRRLAEPAAAVQRGGDADGTAAAAQRGDHALGLGRAADHPFRWPQPGRQWWRESTPCRHQATTLSTTTSPVNPSHQVTG